MPETRGRRRPAFRACVTLLACAIAASTVSVSGKARISKPGLRLGVLLTVSPQVSELSRRTLIGEVARIWQREQIDVQWPSPAGGAERPDAALRVLVIPRPAVIAAAESRWAVGELVRGEGSVALAIASITAARRILEEAGRLRIIDSPVVREHRLGVVLGRAVAHEIGHYLLRTNTHSSTGLMRATIDASEFADLRGATFRLDEAARAHLAQIAARGPVTADSAAFSYPVHTP